MSDRKRILGPIDALRPLSATAVSKLSATALRSEESVRKFFVNTGLSKNANGSAYLEVGNTMIEVCVFGPRPIKGSFVNRASFSVETKFLPYVTQPNEVLFNNSNNLNASASGNGRVSLTNIEHRISTYVETAFLPALLLEKYPKSTIDVFVTVLAFDSTCSSMLNLVSWIVNCTSLAIVDSGVEVRDIVTSGHARRNGTDSQTSLGIDALIASEADASSGTECVASFMAMHNNDMVAIWIEGNGGEGVDANALGEQIGACQKMSTAVRKNLNGHLLEMESQ